MDELIELALVLLIGLLVGWVLGIAGWVQARRARREVAELRTAMRAVGIPLPGEAAWQPPPAPAASVADKLPDAANPWAAASAAAPDPTPPDPLPPPAAPRPGLEEALTLRWGIWLGAGALLLAGIFLVRVAVEEGWLGPAERCALAALLGAALVIGAEWLRRRPLPDRPNLPWPDQAPAALAAGGVAILFGAAYAAGVLYALLPPLLGFALLALAALAALGLALAHGPMVAIIGILGAYLTPALIETENPSLPGLFAYLLVVTAAALAVVRRVGAAWLGWAAMAGAALWVLAGGVLAATPAETWMPALFMPAAVALHLALLPGAALDGRIGRRLAWIPCAVLALMGLVLLLLGTGVTAAAVGLLLLTPVTIAKAVQEPRLDRLPWLAAGAGLLMLLGWPLMAWMVADEAVTIEGVTQALLPGAPWPAAALWPFLIAAGALAVSHAVAGAWFERRAPHPLRWAALPAAVPVLTLLVAYARIRGFALDAGWAVAALGLAAALVGSATLAARSGAPDRAGVHAAGAVAALALGAAMLLADHWLTLAVALFLPPLAFIAARAGLPALRHVAVAVASVVLVRLLLNWSVLDYAFGSWPVLNGLLLAYGVPALSFALAAAMFRRERDDLAVAVLEAGAIAFVTALILLQIRHAMGGGVLDGDAEWSFVEAAWQVSALAVLGTALRLLNRRAGGRPVLRWGWRGLHAASVLLGALLLAWNPALSEDAVIAGPPVLNALLLAFALPAALAALLAAAPEADWPAESRQALAGYAFLAAFSWITLEVRHLFQPGAMALTLADPGEAELYAYSGAWLALGAVLLAVGIRTGARALRLAALALMVLTIAKAFLIDMGGLVGLWRVLSFLGLGLALIGLGWVYRRFVVARPA